MLDMEWQYKHDDGFGASSTGFVRIEVTERRLRAYVMVDGKEFLTQDIVLSKLGKATITAGKKVCEMKEIIRECVWVNVADRLPTEGVNVIVSFVELEGEEVYDAGVTMAYYDEHKKIWSNMGTAKVTAWRPMPEPVDNITMKD